MSLTRWLRRRHGLLVVDPLGFDDGAKRVHDLTRLPSHGRGVWLHHSTCWCRQVSTHGVDSTP